MSDKEDNKNYIDKILSTKKLVLDNLLNIKNDVVKHKSLDFYIHFELNKPNFTLHSNDLDLSSLKSIKDFPNYFNNILRSVLNEKLNFPYIILDRVIFSTLEENVLFDNFIHRYEISNFDEFIIKIERSFDVLVSKSSDKNLNDEMKYFLDTSLGVLEDLAHFNLLNRDNQILYINDLSISKLVSAFDYELMPEVTKIISSNSNLLQQLALNEIKKAAVPDSISINEDNVYNLFFELKKFYYSYINNILDTSISILIDGSDDFSNQEQKNKNVFEFINEFANSSTQSSYPSDDEKKYIAKNLLNNKIDPYILFNFPKYLFVISFVWSWFKFKNKKVSNFVEEFLKQEIIVQQFKKQFEEVENNLSDEIQIIEEFAIKDSNSLQELLAKFKTNINLYKILHNNAKLDEIGFNNYRQLFENLRTNPNIVNSDKTIIRNLFEIILFDVKKIPQENIDAYLNIKKSSDFIDFTSLLNLIDEIKNLSKSKINVSNANLVAKINSTHTQINILKNIGEYYKFINLAEAKDVRIFNLDMELTPSLKFEVLKDLDYRHFTVGVDTNCCQRIGGAGEAASIDSFINSQAGVLVLKYNDEIVSQSYFHYVPDDNGFILDNVESSRKISKNDLTNIYAIYANKIKEKLSVNYFLCGKNYNRISNDSFETTTLENDLRRFKVDKPYTDFEKENALNLLAPINEGKLKEDVLKKYASYSNVFKKLLFPIPLNIKCAI